MKKSKCLFRECLKELKALRAGWLNAGMSHSDFKQAEQRLISNFKEEMRFLKQREKFLKNISLEISISRIFFKYFLTMIPSSFYEDVESNSDENIQIEEDDCDIFLSYYVKNKNYRVCIDIAVSKKGKNINWCGVSFKRDKKVKVSSLKGLENQWKSLAFYNVEIKNKVYNVSPTREGGIAFNKILTLFWFSKQPSKELFRGFFH